MTRPDMIVIDRSELRHLIDTVERLERKIDLVQITPRPEWVTVADAARIHDRSEKTICRWIEAGTIEAKHVGGKRMVRRD
jgi:tRNA isopentenyl-2-thiomethyl-A-37 hydroxylase MiaE